MSALFNWALNSTGVEGDNSNPVVAENTITGPVEITEETDEKDREFLNHSIGGLRIYRDWLYDKYSVVHVVEMDRQAETLGFSVELANEQIIGRESISDIASRL